MLQPMWNPLEFGLYCVIDSNSSSVEFEDFIYMRELSGVPLVRCFKVHTPGPHSQIMLGIHARTGGKLFGFSIVDKANNSKVTLASLKITHQSGTWLFADPSPLPPRPELSRSGSMLDYDGDNTRISPAAYRLYRGIESRLVANLDPLNDDPAQVLKFSIEAVMNTQSGPKQYFADPEIGVETGGDR